MYIDPRTDMVIEFDTHQLFLSDELKRKKAEYLNSKVTYDSYYFEYDCHLCESSWGENQDEHHYDGCPVGQARVYLNEWSGGRHGR